jgi:hypothetical protein
MLSFSYGFNAKFRPAIVETNIVSFANIGEDMVGPISVTHKSEGLRGIIDADTPVRIELPRNICLSVMSKFNNVNTQFPKKNLVANSIYFGLFQKIVQEYSDIHYSLFTPKSTIQLLDIYRINPIVVLLLD